MKKSTLEELKKLVFEQNKATKQNKDKLFKMAKRNNDIVTIERLRDELQFKSAKIYLNKLANISLDGAIRNRDTEILKKIIDNGEDLSQINIAKLITKNTSIEFIKILIDGGAFVDKKNDHGLTALLIATNSNHIELVNLLLDNKTNTEVKNINEETALIIASKKGYQEIAESLIIYGTDLDAIGENKFTALMLAVWNNYLPIVKILLENGADLSLTDIHGVTPLIRASCEGHIEIVKFLLDQNVNIDQEDNDGRTALADAVDIGHKDIQKLLIKNGAKKVKSIQKNNNINDVSNTISNFAKNNNIDKSIDADGNTLLIQACNDNHEDIMKSLIQNGVNINTQNKNGLSPLIVSVQHPKILKYLLDHGANTNLLAYGNATALFAAARDGYKKSVKLLIQYNANLDLFGNDTTGTTPLAMAIHNKHDDIARTLIEAGANVNIQHESGFSALTAALHRSDYDLVEYLVDNGAKIDIDEEHRNILLMKSSFYGYKSILNQLIKEKIDLNLQVDEHTPLMAAIEGNQLDVINILFANNVNIDLKDKNGWTPLMFAIEKKEIVKLLIEAGADIDMTNNYGATALMIAVYHDTTEILEYLLANKAQTDLQDENGNTALIFSAEEEKIDAIKILLDYDANTYLKRYDYDFNDEDEKNDTGHGNSALNIVMDKNDWGTDNNIEAIKLILKTRKTINSLEASQLDILLHKKEIAQIVSKILVDMDGWFMTMLMHTLMINGVIWQSEQWSFSKTEKTEEERKKSADEYMKYNILLTINALLESSVDINYSGGGTTALEQAKSMGMEEVIELLQSYLEKNTLKLSGSITINEGKYTILVKDKEIVFVDTVDEKVEKFQKDHEVKNRYVNSDSYIEISRGKVIHGISNETIEYEIDSISGNPIETDDNHNPKRLVEILNLFTKENPIKHSAHSFEWNKYGSYENFMEKVKKEFTKVENDLKILSSDLHTKINKFLFDDNLDENNTWGMFKMDFGWSSPELKEWCSIEDSKVNGKKAINFPLPEQYQKEIGDKTLVSFENVCSVLKNEIEIRDDDKLKMLFTTIKNDVLKFDFEVLGYKTLDNISFYTDVENFKNGLTLIFEQFKEDGCKQYDTIEIEAIPNENDNYVDIRIMQIGSTVGKKSTEMQNETEDGTFIDIKNCFSSLCDWGIEASFGDGDFRVNYLSSDENSKKPILLKKKPLGFTHILRFYK